MKNRSLSILLAGKTLLSQTLRSKLSLRKSPLSRIALTGLLLASTLGLTACAVRYYKFPVFTFANRPIPPSKLANRVMISVGNAGLGGSGGALVIVDALRDIRMNVQNTIMGFSISGFSGANPTQIYSFPEQTRGYVYSNSGSSSNLNIINYGTESASGTAGSFGLNPGIAIPTDFSRIFAAQETAGILTVVDNATGRTYQLNLPNVYQVAANVGGTIGIAMVRNSNTLYQVVRLNANQFLNLQAAALPINGSTGVNTGGIGAVDCQPVNLPVYCVVPVGGNPTTSTFDRPTNAYFSLDGTTAYILNCGPECGGTTASVTLLQQSVLNINNVASTGFPSGSSNAPQQIANIPTPGGATVAVADGTNLYVAGQQLLSDGLFTGNLSTINLSSNTVTKKVSISDGYHTKLLFADNNTLWVGSSLCATGERAKLNQNYNCLTRYDLGAQTASVIPAVTPGGATTVPYPNTNLNQYYYGDLTGLCWVQSLNKVYTAYGGQVHVFNTTDGSEISNFLVTVQGTALDVAYIDALTNAAN